MNAKQNLKSTLNQLQKSPFAVLRLINDAKSEESIKVALRELGITRAGGETGAVRKVVLEDLMMLDNSERAIPCKIRKVSHKDELAIEADIESGHLASVADFHARTFTDAKGVVYIKEAVPMSVSGYVDALYARRDYLRIMAAKERAYVSMYQSVEEEARAAKRERIAALKAAYNVVKREDDKRAIAQEIKSLSAELAA